MKPIQIAFAACTLLCTAEAQQLKTPTKADLARRYVPVVSSFAPSPLGGGSDLCANAATMDAISGPGNFAVNMVGAATEANPAPGCGIMTNDVFFEWTSTFTGQANISLCGNTTADTVLAVWTGAGCPVGTATACDDDTCAFAAASALTFSATATGVYLIQVGMYNNTPGVATSMDIVQAIPPSNDDCSTPSALTGPGTYAVNNSFATTGSQGQSETSCTFFGFTNVINDIWYTYTPATNGTVTITTCGVPIASLNDDSKIAVYSGAGCPTPLSAIACNDDNCATSPTFGFETTVSFPATCGTTYLIQFGMYGGSGPNDFYTGDMTITETGGIPCATPFTVFCDGSAVGTTCVACGNNGVAGKGCANSVFPGGTQLVSGGIASVSLDTLTLTTNDMTGPGLFFQSSGLSASPIGFGDGMLCAAVGIQRLGVVFPAAGSATYPGGLTPAPISIGGGPISAGNTKHYQAWYRDTPVFCTASTFNTSNGVSVVWGP